MRTRTLIQLSADNPDAFAVWGGSYEDHASCYVTSVKEAKECAKDIDGEYDLQISRVVVVLDPVRLLNHENFMVSKTPLYFRGFLGWQKVEA